MAIEWRAAATAARTCVERGVSPGSARGRPLICTSVTVIELNLAVAKERMKMEKTADATTYNITVRQPSAPATASGRAPRWGRCGTGKAGALRIKF
eukprot:scaffold2627_cov127-Isochrysis_galbana.AAC.4